MAAQWIERHIAVISAVVATSMFGLVELAGGVAKVALVALGIAAVVTAAVLAERRSNEVDLKMRRLRDVADAQRALAEESSAQEAQLARDVKVRDRQLGKALDAVAKELGEEAALDTTERVTVFGLTEVGDARGLVRLARWSPNPHLAGGDREEYAMTGYLRATWERGECDRKIKPTGDDSLKRRHIDDGLPEDQYEMLSLKGRHYIGYRMDTPEGVPVGVVMFEGTAMNGLSSVVDVRSRLSLGQLILSVTSNGAQRDGGGDGYEAA